MNIRSNIQQSEERRLEFKELLPKGSDLCKTIVAIANGAGGTLKKYPEIDFKWFEKGLQFQMQFIKKDTIIEGQRATESKHATLQLVDVGDLPARFTTMSRLSHDQVVTILELCKQPRTRTEILASIDYKNHSDNYRKYMEPLVEQKLITYTIPNIPKSPKQRYIITDRGKELLMILEEEIIEES